jgi:hypothetical protein
MADAAFCEAWKHNEGIEEGQVPIPSGFPERDD